MSVILSPSELTKNERRDIITNCTCVTEPTIYNPDSQKYFCYTEDIKNDSLSIPIGLWKKYFNVKDGFPNGERTDFPKMNTQAKLVVKPLTVLTDPKKRGRDQDVVIKDALNRLNIDGAVFLALFTGFGKSFTAIYLSITLGLKTVLLCHLDIVRKQWPDEYKTFSGNSVKIQVVKGANCKLDPTADVYIIGVLKAANMSRDDFVNIGTVIIDEAHMTSIAVFTKTLLLFHPRYLIGLSATPDKGVVPLMEKYFGPAKDFITRLENKPFIVYKDQTPFKPKISYTIVFGKTVPDWSAIINSIEENSDRWEYIVDIIESHPNEKIIVLCNRNALVNGICEILERCDEPYAKLINKQKTYDKTKRVLVAGFKKGGVGLNDPDLTMAIIASDTQDVRQYEGRLRTTNCIIYHLVDNYRTFQTHFEPCAEWYLSKGGAIKTIGTPHNFTKTNRAAVPVKRLISRGPSS